MAARPEGDPSANPFARIGLARPTGARVQPGGRKAVSTMDLEEQLDNQDRPSDESELEFDDLEDDEELDLEGLDEEDDLVAADDDEDEDDGGDEEGEEDDEEDEDVVPPPSGREGSEPASLDEILAQKPDLRRALDDDDDIMSVVSGNDDVVSEDLPSRIAPMRERQEFVCRSCFLVKSNSQLADKARQLCRECI